MMELHPTAAPPDDGHCGTYTRPRDVFMVVSDQEVERGPRLPPLHRDPFDRLLVAQAIQHDLTIATVDPNVIAYSVKVLRTP